MKFSIRNISKTTPKKMKQWGNGILFATSALATAMMGAPLSPETILWINWILGLIGTFGKLLTSMTTTEDEVTK